MAGPMMGAPALGATLESSNASHVMLKLQQQQGEDLSGNPANRMRLDGRQQQHAMPLVIAAEPLGSGGMRQHTLSSLMQHLQSFSNSRSVQVARETAGRPCGVTVLCLEGVGVGGADQCQFAGVKNGGSTDCGEGASSVCTQHLTPKSKRTTFACADCRKALLPQNRRRGMSFSPSASKRPTWAPRASACRPYCQAVLRMTTTIALGHYLARSQMLALTLATPPPACPPTCLTRTSMSVAALLLEASPAQGSPCKWHLPTMTVLQVAPAWALGWAGMGAAGRRRVGSTCDAPRTSSCPLPRQAALGRIRSCRSASAGLVR